MGLGISVSIMSALLTEETSTVGAIAIAIVIAIGAGAGLLMGFTSPP
jgi:hypothetical protein